MNTLRYLLIVGFIGLTGLTSEAHAVSRSTTCDSPSAAVRTLIDWLQPDEWKPAQAAACLDFAESTPSQERMDAAVKLKKLLDVRLYVDYGALPDNPAYVDPTSKRPRYQLSTREPMFYLDKVGDKWLWSKNTITLSAEAYNKTFLLDAEQIEAYLPSWMQQDFLGVALWKYNALLLLFVLMMLTRVVIRIIFSSQTRAFMKRLGVTLEVDTLRRVAEPFGTAAVCGIANLIIPLLTLPPRLNGILFSVLGIVIAIMSVLVLYRIVDVFTFWMQQRAFGTDSKLDDQLVPLVQRALKIFIVTIGTIFILQNLDYDVASLLAGLGIGGLAFALAAKDTIANLFGSATIFMSKPFQSGDWVTIGSYSSNVEGVVETVGFRSTRIRTFYNSLVSIPNSEVANAVVDNYGAREYRRLRMMLQLGYDTTADQMQAFVEGVRAILKANPWIRQDVYEVHFNGYGTSSLDVLLYAFFKVPSWSEELKQRHNVLLEIRELAQAIGVDFAYPTQTLHVETVAESTQRGGKGTAEPERLAETVKAFGPGGSASRPDGPRLTDGFFPSSGG